MSSKVQRSQSPPGAAASGPVSGELACLPLGVDGFVAGDTTGFACFRFWTTGRRLGGRVVRFGAGTARVLLRDVAGGLEDVRGADDGDGVGVALRVGREGAGVGVGAGCGCGFG
jgi:hypothetical protein